MDLLERKDDRATRHPWEVARAGFFLRLLAEHGLLAAGGDWLDVGAGDGWFARQLRHVAPASSTITCWDINYTADDLAAASEPFNEGISFVAERPRKRFDVLVMLDVIEHVEADASFVEDAVGELLSPGGAVLVSVPAHKALFSSHDRALLHHRRYGPGEARRLLEESGLEIVASGGLFHSLLAVRVGQVLLERLRPRPQSGPVEPGPVDLGSEQIVSVGVGGWRAGRRVTDAVTGALRTDAALSFWLARHRLAVPGLSYWALCRKRANPG